MIDATANTGGGGGGAGGSGPIGFAGWASAGGSGIAIVQQPGVKVISGVWSLSEQYNYKKNNQWT
jgi:hypothetical protein